MTLAEIVTEYLRSQDHISYHTKQFRTWILRSFVGHLANKPCRRYDLAAANWTEEQRARHVGAATIIGRRGELAMFFAWGREKGLLPASAFVPAIHTLVPRPVERQCITPDEYKRLIAMAYPDKHEYWPDAISIGWETGARLADVANLRWEYLDFVQRRLTLIPQKTIRQHKVLLVPLSDALCARLATRQTHDEYSDEPDATRKYVFPAMATQYQFGYQQLCAQFRGYANKLNIWGKTFHCLRHRRVTSLIEAGHSIAIVQAFTGHSLKHLEKYLHVSMETKRLALESTEGKPV